MPPNPDHIAYTESPSPLQEAAVLHSAGFSDAAIALLQLAFAAPDIDANERSWKMLLELHHVTEQRLQFELLAERYGQFFGCAPPGWGYASPIEAPGTLALKGVLSLKSDHLARILEHGGSRRAFAVDMAEVERIDFDHLSALTQLFVRFAAAGKRVILANLGELNATLLESVGADRQVILMRRRTLEDECRLQPAAHSPGGALHDRHEESLLAAA